MEGHTENIYLTQWYREHRQHISVEITGEGNPPAKLVQLASNAVREQRTSKYRRSGIPNDEVWCVFDVDQHPGVPEALQRARDNGVKVAMSNPCIELWFVLHFVDQRAYLHHHQAQDVCESHLKCGKRLSIAALVELMKNYDIAKQRSQALSAEHQSNGSPAWSNPNSSVWEIVDQFATSKISSP